MKKNVFIVAALIAASLLAACGGGGGSGSTPLPVVTPTPIHTVAPTPTPQTYTVTLTYTGGAEPRSGVSVIRKIDAVTRQSVSAASPPPVLLVAPDSNSGLAQFTPGTGDSETLATADVAPVPSASPSSSWSGGDAKVKVANDNQNKMEGVVNAVALNATDNTSVTANVSIPGNPAVTLNPKAFVYNRLTLSCSPSDQSQAVNSNEWVTGVSFDTNENEVPVTTPSDADIYVDGPNCFAGFKNTSEANTTFHFPYGGHVYADGYKLFNQLTTADFQGDQTSADEYNMLGTSSTVDDLIVFKDALGRIHAWDITYAELPYGKNSGATKACDGTAPDGSC